MIDKKLELNRSINECLPVVIEYFIKFYGEQYRRVIENRFGNCTYIGYVFPEDMKRYLDKLYQDKLKELYNAFLKERDIEVNQSNREKYFGYRNNLLNEPNKSKLSTLFEYIYNELDNIYIRNNLLQMLREFSGNKKLMFGVLEFYEIIEEVKQLKSSFDKIVQEFDEYKFKYIKYDNYVNSCNDLKKKIGSKYLLIYLKEVYEYLSEHDKEIVDKVSVSGEELDSRKLDCYGILCGDSYSGVALVDSFSAKSEEMINSLDTPKYILNSIYSDRVKYFKKLGIYLGKNYDSYVSSNECSRVIPDSKLVDKVIELRKKLSEEERMEYLTSTSLYKEYLLEINNLDLFSHGKNSNYSDFVSGVTYIEPNLRFVDGDFSLYILLVINSNLSDYYFDNSFIHECCHLNDTSIIYQGDVYCVIRSGFEVWLIVTDKDKYDLVKDKCLIEELEIDLSFMDEIINELIAQDITEMLHNDGIYLLDDKETSKVGGFTVYEKGRCLVEKFYIEFKEEIKYSKNTGDMGSLYKMVGKENFLSLNSLVNEYMAYFDNDRYDKMVDDYEAGYETNDTLFYDECLDKAEMIFAKMKSVASRYISGSSHSM